MVDAVVKPSKVEKIKEESQNLRGNLSAELADENPYVSNESYELLKFHGSYQGYDRDSATDRKKAGLEKLWEFMVRMKCPAGKLTAKQYLALDKICEKYANNSLRITTRETFQFHCIVKENLKKHIQDLNKELITTLGGCGDVVRNVTCVNAPIKDKRHQKLLEDAFRVDKYTLPKTGAYHEIWLDGKNVATQDDSLEENTVYDKLYLPRKFKIGLGLVEDNSVDVLTNDLGIIILFDDNDNLIGYNFCLGGGLGMTHNKANTYPRLATPLFFVKEENLLEAVKAVIKLQSDHGNRSNRKLARLKYVIDEHGLDWTKKTVEENIGFALEDAKPMNKFTIVDHMGWHDQKDGKLYLGLPVSSGRIIDRDDEKIKTALKEVIEKYQMDLVLTADQNIILCDIEEKDKADIENIFKSYNVKLREEISNVYRDMIACVALPTCGKALAEAERIKLPFVAEFEKLLEKHQLSNDKISVRIAGCPNGCSRPYAAEIGIVGRTPGFYALFIGGDYQGSRLNSKIFDKVPYDKIIDVFDILFTKYIDGKNDNESFGDFAHRIGEIELSSDISEKLGIK